MTVHRGVSVAPGIAMGVVYLRGYESEEDFPLRIPSDQVENELNRLRSAIELSRRQIEDLKERHGETLGDAELRIFDVHIAYLSDPMFVDEIEKLVLEERFSVRAAIRKVVDDYDRIFQLVESENLRQRAGDFRDVATRLKRNVAAMNEEAPPPKPPPAGRYVLAARKLTVNDLFQIDNERVEGIVAEEGGISSHAGILARSMGIPTITGIRDLPGKLRDNSFVIVDGSAGELHVDPDERLRAEYEEASRTRPPLAFNRQVEREHATRDGVQVCLLGACGNLAEVNLAAAYGMAGIGLYRTELMFLVGDRLPSEDMLVHHYRDVVRQPHGRPVAFRLLDIASHVNAKALPLVPERNPALGLRGVRALFALQGGNILRLQLRAILRAAAGLDTVSVLVPFVTSLSDIQRVRAAIVEERLELVKRGEPCAERLDLAPIVEVPAAAFVCRRFMMDSERVVVAIDDLQALLLAADRDTPGVRDYYTLRHPALFELLARMAREAAEADKELVLFGEGAADADLLPFYLGVGIRSFAVAPVNLTRMLDVMERTTIEECRVIGERLLEAPRSIDVQRILLTTRRR